MQEKHKGKLRVVRPAIPVEMPESGSYGVIDLVNRLPEFFAFADNRGNDGGHSGFLVPFVGHGVSRRGIRQFDKPRNARVKTSDRVKFRYS